MTLLRRPLFLLAAVLLALPVQAQELLRPLVSPNEEPDGQFGTAVAGVPDVDGDGRGDLLVGAQGEDSASFDTGRAYVLSGTSGALLFELEPEFVSGNAFFGNAVSGVPDFDGDGADDFLVGAFYESIAGLRAGAAYILSGADGTPLDRLSSPHEHDNEFLYFGNAVAGVPDVDGDGRGDLLIGAYGDDTHPFDELAYGRAYLFKREGASRVELRSPNEEVSGRFGWSVAAVPDVDGDGRYDLLIGAPGENSGASPTDAGRAYLFSGRTGALLGPIASPHEEASGQFGYAAAGVPDVNGDGWGDLVVGTPFEDPGASPTDAGRAYLFDGRTGALLVELASPHEQASGYFGRSVAAVPDLDGDGFADLFVGASGEAGGSGTGAGRGYVFSGATGALLVELASPNVESEGAFGWSVAGVPDADGDGRGDLAVGAPNEGPGASPFGAGRAYLFRGTPSSFAVTPQTLDFGLLAVGAMETRPLTVSHVLGGPLTITDLALGGDDPGQFEIASAPPLPFVLQPGERVTVEVTYTPTRGGPAEALLVVASDRGTRTAALRGAAGRAVLVVTTAADAGDGTCDADCTLREAILALNATSYADTVRFAPAVNGQTISFTDALPALQGGFLVDADGQAITVVYSGTDRFVPTLEVAPEAEGAVVGLTITNSSALGIGVINAGTLALVRCTVRENLRRGVRNAGAMTIAHSTISGNASYEEGGAGVYNEGTLAISNSTISGNDAENFFAYLCGGGGICNASPSPVLITNSTVTRNSVAYGPGGLDGAFVLSNSVVAGNTRGGNPSDCDSEARSDGYNVFSTGGNCTAGGPGDVAVPTVQVFTRVLDPDLEDNSGPTRTHALVYRDDNPAIDLGGVCGPTDQRGLPAPLDGPDANVTAACDAGAVEADAPALAVVLVPENAPVVVPPSGDAFTLTATLTNTGSTAQTLQAWARAVLPDGTTTGVLVGPLTVTLGPGQSVTRTLTQRVPANTPAGRYAFVASVGAFPDGAVDGASFPVVKEGAPERVAAVWPPAEGASDAVQAASAGLPSAWALHGARPNPFAARTVLGYDLPAPSHVRLVVYDVLGREVALLVDGEREAGRHEAPLDGRMLPSGSYLVRLEAGGFVQTRHVTLVR